jgi:hypothetical protein
MSAAQKAGPRHNRSRFHAFVIAPRSARSDRSNGLPPAPFLDKASGWRLFLRQAFAAPNGAQ